MKIRFEHDPDCPLGENGLRAYWEAREALASTPPEACAAHADAEALAMAQFELEQIQRCNCGALAAQHTMESEPPNFKRGGAEVMKPFDLHSPAYVGIHPSIMTPGTGTIYVIIEDRPAFDLIDLPVTDHGQKPNGHVLSKVIDGPWYIIFQHWIKVAAEVH